MDAKRFRDPTEIQHAQVPDTSLYARHVGAVDLRCIGERLLADPFGLPQIANPDA
jgi:hypothetical protein